MTSPHDLENPRDAMLFDMHCHLDFVESAADFEALISHRNVHALSNTVTPQGYAAARDAFERSACARLALGAHPWWIADGRLKEEDLALFEALAPDTPFIGEVGLDFRGPRVESKDLQVAALTRILAVCEGKLISLHASAAEARLLDLLERSGATTRNECILHWYAGPADQLQRALDLGCYFSVGKRMLASKRGREYARIIPLERLLLESDMPSQEGARYTPVQWEADLSEALQAMAKAREVSTEALLEAICATSEALLRR